MSNDYEASKSDPAAVTEAIRRLVETAVAEDTSLISRLGYWPDDVQHSASAAAILHPVSFACQRAANIMVGHLGSLIGEQAARAQFAAIIAEQTAAPEVRAAHEKVERTSGKASPSSPRSVH